MTKTLAVVLSLMIVPAAASAEVAKVTIANRVTVASGQEQWEFVTRRSSTSSR
jgi:hypothetical protein